MDNLATPYVFVEHLRYGLESGESLMSIIKRFVLNDISEFSFTMNKWIVFSQQERYTPGDFQKNLPIYRKSIFDLLDLAKSGASIVEPLKSMEKELISICENDLQRHIDKLPFQLMIPMLFLQFPAVLILIIGPLLIQFFSEVGS
jgi:hypothetical protein